MWARLEHLFPVRLFRVAQGFGRRDEAASKVLRERGRERLMHGGNLPTKLNTQRTTNPLCFEKFVYPTSQPKPQVMQSTYITKKKSHSSTNLHSLPPVTTVPDPHHFLLYPEYTQPHLQLIVGWVFFFGATFLRHASAVQFARDRVSDVAQLFLLLVKVLGRGRVCVFFHPVDGFLDGFHELWDSLVD